MLGTDLKHLLEKCGVTQEWYKETKGRFGLDPTCDCDMYEDIINQTHAAWKKGGWKEARKAYNKAVAHYAKPR